MTPYASLRPPPKVLTSDEQKRLLAESGRRAEDFRDHMIFSIALATALRRGEIQALDVGDVTRDGIHVFERFPLRVFKWLEAHPDGQECIVPPALRLKLEKFLRWKRRRRESIAADAPLFLSNQGTRLCERQINRLFDAWQKRAGFQRHHVFHALRHTALTNVYRASRDILVTQRVARHRSVESTLIYAHVCDEEMLQAVSQLPC